MSSFPRLLATLLACLATGPAGALEFRFLAWDDQVAQRELAVVSGERQTPIERLHPLKRTEPIDATPGENGLVIRALDRTGEDEEPLDFTVRVGSELSRPLVLLLPDPEAPAGVRGHALEDDLSSFEWGSYRIINATAKTLNLAFGEQRVRLPTGWKPVDLEPKNDALPVWFSSTDEPEQPLYTNVWQTGEDIRRLVFVVPGTDVRLGPIAMKIIPEDRRHVTAENDGS